MGMAKLVIPWIVTAVQLQNAARYVGVTTHATAQGRAMESSACENKRKRSSEAASELRSTMQRVGISGRTQASTWL